MTDYADKGWLAHPTTALEHLAHKAAAARGWLGRRAACHPQSLFRYRRADQTNLASTFRAVRGRLGLEG